MVLLTSEKWLQSCSYYWLLRCCLIVFTFLNSFRVKAGRVANNSCGLSGQSLVFGMDPAIASLEGRIGVTPPLDLRTDVGSVEPTSEAGRANSPFRMVPQVLLSPHAHHIDLPHGRGTLNPMEGKKINK